MPSKLIVSPQLQAVTAEFGGYHLTIRREPGVDWATVLISLQGAVNRTGEERLCVLVDTRVHPAEPGVEREWLFENGQRWRGSMLTFGGAVIDQTAQALHWGISLRCVDLGAGFRGARILWLGTTSDVAPGAWLWPGIIAADERRPRTRADEPSRFVMP